MAEAPEHRTNATDGRSERHDELPTQGSAWRALLLPILIFIVAPIALSWIVKVLFGL